MVDTENKCPTNVRTCGNSAATLFYFNFFYFSFKKKFNICEQQQLILVILKCFFLFDIMFFCFFLLIIIIVRTSQLGSNPSILNKRYKKGKGLLFLIYAPINKQEKKVLWLFFSSLSMSFFSFRKENEKKQFQFILLDVSEGTEKEKVQG